MSIRDIKRRINTIKNIKQITRAMSLVAATKLQRMRRNLDSSRQFFFEMKRITQDILPQKQCDSTIIVVITSDRGLCGSYNNNVFKVARELYLQKPSAKLFVIGAKGIDIALRYNDLSITKQLEGISDHPSYDNAIMLSKMLLEFYNAGNEIYLAYTEFHSAVSFEPVVTKLLPAESNHNVHNQIVYEPSKSCVANHILPKYVSTMMYGAIIESAVCEQSSRMLSMDTATDNASEMIDKLTLLYNRARQSQITQELTEIIGGANALK